VTGALERHNALPDWVDGLRELRDKLIASLESGSIEGVAGALRAAQENLTTCYGHICTLDEAEALCEAVGFPPPGRVTHNERFIEAVDVATMHVTFTRFGKQTLANFAFRDAAGATAYWLHEVRYIDGERSEWARLEDPIMESYAPLFTRVRLPVGTRHFRIESRNPHENAISEEFTIEVPAIQ
jgi:hypothetical protein